MSAPLTPASVTELVEAVRSAPRVLAIGAGTKPRLSDVEAVKISTAKLRGVIEYDPGEFTFTALAGTPIREIMAALAEQGQYLPFDPMLVDTGATLGGMVAAGLSGPGRFRFGGVRDFVLGVRFVDGEGRLLRMGGKVVKNAAGFDLPKFFVGSLSRFGVLAELTFKVFPRPASMLTLKLPVKNADAAVLLLTEAANARWEADALDYLPEANSVFLRLTGPVAALEDIAREVLARFSGEKLLSAEVEILWTKLREFSWADSTGPLIKVPLTPVAVPSLCKVVCSLGDARVHVSAGGNAAFVSLQPTADAAVFGDGLYKLGLSGLTLRGDAPLWCGVRNRPQIASAVKQALDPQNRFPPLDD